MITNDINIVCNNCLGAALMEQYGVVNTNPFMWCAIQPNSYFKLMTEWDSLDFVNVETFRLGDVRASLDETPLGTDNSVLLVLDNQINIFFMHHFVDANKNEFMVINHNAYYHDMLNYVRQKWLERANRMEYPPQFLLRQTSMFNFDRVQTFIDLKTKYQKYLISYDLSILRNTESLENCSQMKECSIFDVAKVCRRDNFIHRNIGGNIK